MTTDQDRDRNWQDRRERHARFVAASPMMTIRIVRPIGPYKVGETPTVTAAVGNDYVARRYAEKT
ncbi:hypothetical protein [Bosea sp. RAC05]|uniref:hypothetical protein n=1 Tax=Bosea sp. RAC05 TaxID=1842539 RepID=UPI00083E05A8|nr:hypothetical protein [Bosea sp. RAC05]AOG02851.1 hypothetical protein BSY19_5415 [Bosea sp. RAC05]